MFTLAAKDQKCPFLPGSRRGDHVARFGYLKFWREILNPGAHFQIYPNLQYDEMGRHFIMLIISVE